jgi:CRISPR-associated endonuclease/helicase Cas3
LKLAAEAGPDRIAALIGAYCIAGHHSGLPDWRGDRALSDRLKKQLPPLDPAWQRELTPVASSLFPSGFRWLEDKSSFALQLAMFGRMLFSCLIDADRRDTESFYASTEGKPVDRKWPTLAAIVERLIARFDAHMAGIALRARDNRLGPLRADILAHARGKATLSRGVFTLNVPTGGGKTLASLGFAIDRAKAHGMERIVYGIPFTSIIDQTSEIFRDVLGKDVVLEHHSAIEDERRDRATAEQRGEADIQRKLRLAMGLGCSGYRHHQCSAFRKLVCKPHLAVPQAAQSL